MKPLELNILFFSDYSAELEALEIPQKDDDYIVDKMTFYSINGISRYEETNEDWCMIYSNGDDFICPQTYEIVKQKIETNL